MPGLEAKDYKQAIEIQDACNLSGVVHTFSRTMTKIWEEASMNQKSTDWVNKHPIAVLYADKIAHLTTGKNIVSDMDGIFGSTVNLAWEICAKKGKE